MKTTYVLLSVLLAVVLLTACSDLFEISGNSKSITPSNIIINEQRTVKGFTAIDMRTLGEIVLTQGDSESLTITGSDNLVPLIKTSISEGRLVIEMQEPVNIASLNKENLLTFTINVKNLNAITVSGFSNMEMESLSTSRLAINMSGAGQVKVGQLTADGIDITISGAGNVDVTGEVEAATINIPGAGNVNAPDLKIQTANVTISGIGNAKVWVIDQLTGTISGGGSVYYYGDPQTSTQTTGLGHFNSLGPK